MPWNTKDLDFDPQGNLIIYEKDLAARLEKEINKGNKADRFKIKLETSGGGGPQVNAMCPC